MMHIDGKTQVAMVWGHPVSHSRSPRMHNAALAELGLNWAYLPFDVSPDCIVDAVAGVRALGVVGMNVTVPLKEKIPPLLDTLSQEALQVGAVNTIVNRNGRLHGDSTDGPGFLRALEEIGQAPVLGSRALLLGAGGSARAVAFALAGQGCHVVISNRTEERAQGLADAVNIVYAGRASVVGWGANVPDVGLVVNATSLGMTPRDEEMPALAATVLATRPFVYDLIYQPPETRLLALARAAGCPVANGLGMLVWQGALSLSLWTGLPLSQMPIAVMTAAISVP